jgi:hypothetical protein
MSASSATDRYITRSEIPAFLGEHGYPISRSTIDKLSMPSRGANDGPPSEGAWGNRHLYLPERVLDWARRRFKLNGSNPDHQLDPGAPARIAERDRKRTAPKRRRRSAR